MTTFHADFARFSLADASGGYHTIDIERPVRIEVEALFGEIAEALETVVGFRLRLGSRIEKTKRETLDGNVSSLTLRLPHKGETYGAHFEYVTWRDDGGKLVGLAEHVGGPSSHPKLRELAPDAKTSIYGLWRE